METSQEEHIKKVSEWIINIYTQQGCDIGESYFVRAYPSNFRRILTPDGVKIVYQETMKAIVSAN